MIAPTRRPPSPLLPLCAALLAVAAVAPACRKQDQIGSITQYTRGGQDGGGGGQDGVGGAGSSGLVTLKALFAGALLGQGAPEVGTLVPLSGEVGVLPTSPVVAVFTESVDLASVDAGSFQLLRDTGFLPEPVTAGVFADLATDGRVAVLLPTQPLQLGAQYTIQIGGVEDLEGNPLKVDGSTSDGGPFGGGVPGSSAVTQSFQVFTPGFQAPVFGVVAMYPPPGDTTAKRDTLIRLFFNAPVNQAAAAAVVVEADGQPVAGDADVGLDPRIVEFVPADPFPLGADVTVRVPAGVNSLPIPGVASGGLALFGDFVESFSINSVPTPKSIDLPDNAPFEVAGVMFDGTLTKENLKGFKADVKVPSASPSAQSTTLLFFQPKGAGDAAARAFTKDDGKGTVKFDVNLGKGDDDAAFTDSDEAFPPQPMLIGAFAQRGGLRSPVGPVELPRVFVETSDPDVAFGPPSEDGDPYTFRGVVADAGLYGTATESLTMLEVVATTGPATTATFGAFVLGLAPTVTDPADLFLTLPPAPAVDVPRFLPLPIQSVTAVDTVGNERVVGEEKAGEIHYEGSIGGDLEPTAMEDLRVRVVAAHTLRPVKNVVVRLDDFPYTAAGMMADQTTGKDGEAVFTDTSGFAGQLLVTASKDGFDPFTVAGFGNPAFGDPMGISIVLTKTGVPDLKVDVTAAGDIPGAGGGGFAASAASGGRPANGKGPDTPDERFFVADLDGGTDTFLRAPPARPFLVSSLQSQGTAHALDQSGVLASTADLAPEFDFAAKVADGDVATEFATEAITDAQVTDTGVGAASLVVGRLIATLPGLPDVFPLSLSPPQPPGGGGVNLLAPIPPSLFQDEALPDLDPAYEVLLQPSAAVGGGAPGDALLEAALRLEVEAAETGETRLTRQRLALDFDGLSNAVAAEPVALPNVYDVMKVAGTLHPAEVVFSTAGTAPGFDLARSMVRIRLSAPPSKTTWTVVADALRTDLAPGTFEFPPLGIDPFDAGGEFDVVLEVIEMPPGFDFGAFTFSDVERFHRRLSRSATKTIDTSTVP